MLKLRELEKLLSAKCLLVLLASCLTAIATISLFVTNRLQSTDQILKEQYLVIHNYTASISEALPAVAMLDEKTQNLLISNSTLSLLSHGFTLLSLVASLILCYISYERYKSKEDKLVMELYKLNKSDSLNDNLSFSEDSVELRVAINRVLEKRSRAISDANSLVQHLYSMAFENLKSITAVAARIHKQDSEAVKLAVKVSSMTGAAKILESGTSKVVAAANATQERVSRTKQSMVEIRKAIDFLKLELETVNSSINEITLTFNELEKAKTAIAMISDKIKLLAINSSIEAANGNEAKVLADVVNKISDLSSETDEAKILIGKKLSLIQSKTQETFEPIANSKDRSIEALHSIQKTNLVIDSIGNSVTNVLSSLDKLTQSDLLNEDVNEDLHKLKSLSKDSMVNITGVADVWKGQLELIKDYKEATIID